MYFKTTMGAYLLLLGMYLELCSGANILGLFPMPIYSHTKAYLPIFEELARRGHNVTVVSPYPRKEPMANYTDIFIPTSLDELMRAFAKSGMLVDPHDTNFFKDLWGIAYFCPVQEEEVLMKPEVLNFINEDQSHFDVIVTETWICQEPLTALSHKYSAHLIGINPFELGSLEGYYTGNTVPYSYVPHHNVEATDHMTFIQKLKSSILSAADILMHLYYYMPKKESFMRNYIKFPGSENLPPLEDILKNHSIVLVDWHFSLTFPRPYQRNVVEYGGHNINDEKPLPKELEEYMSNATDGVIYFSWGSIYKAKDMKPDTLAKFLSVFSKLKQRVLMKWEEPELPGKPDNVMIAPWFPQASVLRHPKLVAFISHCGVHGVVEATYNGVPILGTPLFVDQYQNSRFVENAGYGIFLDIDSFSEEFLLESLQKIIYDPSYKEAALRRSAIMKDRPLPPIDNAIYWIEYVIRHNGARHLRPASLDIPWYQYFLLDVIGLLLAVFLLLLVGIVTLCRFFCHAMKKLFTTRKAKID